MESELIIVVPDEKTREIAKQFCGSAKIIVQDKVSADELQPIPERLIVPAPEIKEPILIEDERPYWNRQKRGKGNKFKNR